MLAQRGLQGREPPSRARREAPRRSSTKRSQERIIALTIGLEQLCEIRQARLRQLGMPGETNYAMREHVRQEIDFANALFKAHPDWPLVDVTGRAIEETAVIILEHVKERDERAKAPAARSCKSRCGRFGVKRRACSAAVLGVRRARLCSAARIHARLTPNRPHRRTCRARSSWRPAEEVGHKLESHGRATANESSAGSIPSARFD